MDLQHVSSIRHTFIIVVVVGTNGLKWCDM